MTTLLSWLRQPATDRGVWFHTADGGWDFWPYDRLAGLVRDSAAALRESGVRPGDVVAVVERTGPHFVGLLFGTMLAGATVAPLAPPATFTDPERYVGYLRAAFAATGPALVVCVAEAADRVASATPAPALTTDALLRRATRAGSGTGSDTNDADPAPSALALIQCTSGTTGLVRGVRVPFGALAANTSAIAAWLEMTPADPTASWLPVHHDMGLVGCLFTPVITGCDLWLMAPADFVRRPLTYLERFGRQGARLTALPAFALDHIVRRVPADALAGMDFAAWRAIIVGAERIAPGSLERFAARCAPHGLARDALLPAYGLAEATLAVTGLPLREGWRAVPGEATGAPVVGCGRPLGGVRVTVVDEAGEPVPDGRTGEIVVGGLSVTAGYHTGTSGPTRLRDGTVRTGDAGLLRDGQLYVLGRLGDGLKVRGRLVVAEDLDAALVAGLGVAPGRVATVLGGDDRGDTAVVVLERPKADWLPAVPALLRPHLDGVPVVPVDVPVGAIPRTTSGKPRRRELWQAYVSGRLARRATG
jgi:acyl-CoA synthetase (AMP-forming)/AMP-acid ligase II